MLDAGANTELAKPNGITSRKPAVWTVSALRSETPSKAISQLSAKPQARIRPSAAAVLATLACSRNPNATPTATVITVPQPVRSTSATMRPATIALRAMGSERNRSIRPCWKPVFSPMAVCMAQNVTPWTISPGSTNSI